MRLTRCLFFLLLAAVSASPVTAQEVTTAPALVPGQRARITYHRLHRRIIGEVVSYDERELVFRKSGDSSIRYITWNKIARVEESVGQHTRGETVMRATATGLLAGVAVGAGLIASHELITAVRRERRSDISFVAVRGVIITTVAGGFLGFTWPRDSWRHVPLHGNPPRLTIGPMPDGRVGLGLSFGALMER